MKYYKTNSLAEVISTQHQDYVIATGVVEARDDVVLSFEENGSVQQVHYDPGDPVAAGSVIASLNAGSLLTEVAAQRSALEKEIIYLNSFVDGPEENERAKVNASTAVSEQRLENAVSIALVSAQQTAGNIETLVRTQVDALFDVSTGKQSFKGTISAIDKQQVNKARQNVERILVSWRVWSNTNDTNAARVITILQGFDQDLRKLHDIIIEMQDTLLAFRALSDVNEEGFVLLTAVRTTLLEAIVTTIENLNTITVGQVQHRLVLAESNESLSGGTEAQRSAQSAQVDTERERLRNLELQLQKIQIRAPFSGVIGEIFVSPGEFISIGTNAARIVSKDGFDLSVDITEIEIQNIFVGQQMRAEIEATGDSIDVRVRTINVTEKRINDVPVYTVTFDVIDESALLRSGMTVDVYIPSGEAVDVFAVPQISIVKKGSIDNVLVQRGDTMLLIPITIGAPLDDGLIVVTGELYVGDVVIYEQEE